MCVANIRITHLNLSSGERQRVESIRVGRRPHVADSVLNGCPEERFAGVDVLDISADGEPLLG